ncbi:hypothetical protein H310_06144 [Aphanomyces invadans]|uniref:EF-hand domain-containing protein n=2 Tax=Aphanomyces invadans TaxID=157072 RepID=A0A024U907_9STRA|nr:hypothetical protein H310_06144 [Aphanomyces invadans]ETW02705.1 hypothetical protein H310_06144 [Aphanomyces invadans]|eukprot:XP_008869310.1 hypothetical protein H310_06144 [Aphanomyces invadans]
MAAQGATHLRCPRDLHEKVVTRTLLDIPSPKLRKRVHVGCTNLYLTKAASAPTLHPTTLLDEKIDINKLSTLSIVHQTNKVVESPAASKPLQLSPVTSPPRPHTSHEMLKPSKDPSLVLDQVISMRRGSVNGEAFSSGRSDVLDAFQLEKDNPVTKAMFVKNRDKIRDRVATKFGSMRAMFRAFDNEGSGGISLEQFHKSIGALGLDISEADQVLLYKMVDTNGNNSIDFKEFSAMFESEPMRNSFVDTGNSAESLKARIPLKVSPRTKCRIEAFQLELSQKLLTKQVSQQVAYGSNSKVLLNAFRHMDTNGDGSLSYDELKNALGPQMLDLEVDPTELQAMLTTIDSDKNGYISYKEFIKFFSLKPDVDQDDIFHIGRQRELELLASNATRDANDPPPHFVNFDEDRKQLEPITSPRHMRTFENEPGCIQEQLSRRTRDLLSVQAPKQDSAFDIAPHKFPGDLDGFFASLAPLSVSKGKHNTPIEWSRIGVGGNGVNTKSALYMPDTQRFVTTTNEQYSPMHGRRPRMGIPQQDLEKKAMRIKSRYEKTSQNLSRIEHNKEQRKLQSQWEEKSRLRAKSKQRHSYSDAIIKTEDKLFEHKNKMAKKPGGASFHRMWAGSLESQFNSQPWGLSKEESSHENNDAK